MNLLTREGGQSSMRFVFIMMSIGVFLMLLALSFYVIQAGVKGTIIKEWMGMSAFLTALAAMITGLGWNKVQQKKVESTDRVTEMEEKKNLNNTINHERPNI